MKVAFDVFDQDRDVAYFQAGTRGWSMSDDASGITAFDHDTGDILAVWVLDRFTGPTAMCHGVMTNSIVMKYGWAEEVAGFTFEHHDLVQANAMAPVSTPKIDEFAKWLGFIEVARIPDGHAPDDDYIGS